MITIAETAKAYIAAAERCEEQRTINERQFQILLVPSITNRAFAAELYLKAIAMIDGKKLRGHDLKNLFDSLTEDRRSAIIAAVGTEEISFLSELEKNANLFVDWRYLFEKSDIQVSWQFLKKFAYSAKEIFEKAVSR